MLESHQNNAPQKELLFLFLSQGNNNLMLMLTPNNIFKAGYIFSLPSILAPSSPVTSKKLFEASSVEFLNLDDTHCGKISVIYSFTHTNRVRAGVLS